MIEAPVGSAGNSRVRVIGRGPERFLPETWSSVKERKLRVSMYIPRVHSSSDIYIPSFHRDSCLKSPFIHYSGPRWSPGQGNEMH